MQKIKSIKMGGLLSTIKCSLIGIVATLIGTVIFAVILKFASLSSSFISHINNIIKIFSIFIMVMCVKRNSADNLLVKSLFAGLFYALFSFIIFSILNGSFVWNMSFLYDLLFAIIASAIVSVIINILKHKSM